MTQHRNHAGRFIGPAIAAFLLIAVFPVAPVAQATDERACFDEQAYIIENVIPNATPQAPEENEAPPAGIDPTNMPFKLSTSDFILNASTIVASVVSGSPVQGATVHFVCAPPDALLTLTDPTGRTTTAASTSGQEAYFYGQTLPQAGVWTLTDETGNAVTTFDTGSSSIHPSLEASDALGSTTQCAPSRPPPTEVGTMGTGIVRDPGDPRTMCAGASPPSGDPSVPEPCQPYWRSSRSLYEAPTATTYATSMDAYAPYISRYWTLKDHWTDGCGGSFANSRSLRHEFSVVGASRTTQGGTLYTAIVGGGLTTTCEPYGGGCQIYYTKNNGAYLDQTSTTYLKMGPFVPAAYQANSGGTVGGGSDSVMDLACAFVTQSMAWWASTMVCDGVNYVNSPNGAGDVPYAAAQSGWYDGFSGMSAGGIQYNYNWKENTYEVQTGLALFKTSNTDEWVYLSTFFTTGGKRCWRADCPGYWDAPTETWGANTVFKNYGV